MKSTGLVPDGANHGFASWIQNHPGQGFAGTSVEVICSAAGVTKGSIFHHFESKEAIGRAAVERWGRMGTSLYNVVWQNSSVGPLQRLHRMLDIMTGSTMRKGQDCGCMVGMMSQELASTNPVMQAACAAELQTCADNVARMLAEA